MTRITLFLLSILIITFSCKKDSNDVVPPEDNEPDDLTEYVFTLNFRYGVDLTPTAYKNIYVIWAENKASSFIQNISVCSKLVNGGLTGTALPYWKTNVNPNSENEEIDAVTGATQANTDFSVSFDLKNNTVREFTLFFEVDRSFNPNDWFDDQPSLLYSADINLDDNVTEYELLPTGWTPNENTQNIISNTPMGTLQNELRYITHHKDNSSFGDVDERGAVKMVGKITVTLN